MAHINHSRDIVTMRSMPLSEALSGARILQSVAAFGGTSRQRRESALYTIRRFCSHMGVIVLQNDQQLANQLGLLGRQRTELAIANPNFRTYNENPAGSPVHYYDPLYGLSASGVLDAIIPADSAMPDAFATRGYLSAYLEILLALFRKDSVAFGDYPYSLDILLQLVEMSPLDLERSVLPRLPSQTRDRIRAVLMHDGAQLSAYTAVNSFAAEMATFLWTRRMPRDHTQSSMIDAVQRGCISCVTMPAASLRVLHYIYLELRELINRHIPFMLVVDDVDLSQSDELCQLFMAPHESSSYCTAVFEPAISQIARNDQEVGSFLAQHASILVFACSNAQQAQPFSDALGTYQRTITDRNVTSQRTPFAIFSSHGNGSTTHETQEHNITVEDLMGLGSGAVLCGNLYHLPEIIESINLGK